MDFAKLESSNLETATYNGDDHELYILFRSGKTYKFTGVPREIYRDLVKAESHGKYFLEYIKDHFPCVIVIP